MKTRHTLSAACKLTLLCLAAVPALLAGDVESLPSNRWVEITKDMGGGRRGSALRYAPGAKAFFLWGFMNDDPEMPQENRLVKMPEYDMVFFDPSMGRWQNHLPLEKEKEWSQRLPLAYVPGNYSGITTGSRRTIMRGESEGYEGVPRPALNIVADQIACRGKDNTLLYFTGGLTAAYDVERRAWKDLKPAHSPPPVLGGSLAYDPAADEVILFGGGHVAEPGEGTMLRGYTGTWVYSYKDNDWRPLSMNSQPPPRMYTRMVTDTRNRLVVLFGGDGQRVYFADTWIFDLKKRTWRVSKARGGPDPRAGHFAVYDPDTGLMIIGGGYNRSDLTDMWAYDAAKDRWQKLVGDVPTGFDVSADIAPDRRLIVLTTNNRKPGDRMGCNTLYPVRTTYGYRIDRGSMFHADQKMAAHTPLPKRPPEDMKGMEPDRARSAAQAARLRDMPVNQWVSLNDPGRVAPLRTWGTATFDTDRGQILYWGGQHCGYGGGDVDAYIVDEHTWRGEMSPEYPGRTWDKGVSLAGVTFEGHPWTEHGRKIYAYDPVSRKMIMVRPVGLTEGYEPEWVRSETRTSCPRCVTFAYDPETLKWERMAPSPPGLTALVTTPRGVMGVNVAWSTRLTASGNLRTWEGSADDRTVFLFEAKNNRWIRLGEPQLSPQNMYEMTSLAYDSKRDQVILHGGGTKRDELWIFNIKTGRWRNMQPKVVAPEGAAPPECTRESVYIPGDDVVLVYGPAPQERNMPAIWEYSLSENVWRRVKIEPMTDIDPRRRAGQNRAMVYDPGHDLVLLVLGPGGDAGPSAVFAMRYRHAQAQYFAAK